MSTSANQSGHNKVDHMTGDSCAKLLSRYPTVTTDEILRLKNFAMGKITMKVTQGH